MHLEPEEDVEAHANKGSHVSRNAGKDDDVEGHMQLNRNLGHTKGQTKGHTKGHEDDDDVEAHVNKGQQKA
jgi:hypothetical protein